MNPIARNFLQIGAALIMAQLASVVHADTTPSELAGHYYLSGVRETGSELVLDRDGRFAWFMAYGAVDQQAEGQWRRDGAWVVLTPDLADKRRPLFRLGMTTSWDSDAEQLLIDFQQDQAEAMLAERCPLPTAPAVAVAAPALLGGAGQASTQTVAPAPPAPGCAVPPRREAAQLTPQKWTRGIALLLRTDRSGARIRTVKATLHFADGRSEVLQDASRGVALKIGPAPSPAISVTLSAPFAPGRDATLTLPALHEGVIGVLADEAQLVPPPFETLRLRIEGKALIPEAFGKGHYDRQP